MIVKRNLRFGNTEETYQFCMEEIMFMQAVYGIEETKVFLVNNKDYYILPNGIGSVSKIIDDTLLRTNHSMCRVGRSTIINMNYLSIIGTDTIRLVAEIDGIKTEENIKVSNQACEKLASAKGLTKRQQQEYQRMHFDGGYVSSSYGGGPGYTGFMVTTYEPCERPESYYDINEDEIMFLGV